MLQGFVHNIVYLLQIICCEHTCNVSIVPSSCVICVRNTMRQRVDFFLLRGPAVWSGNRCSTSTFLSYCWCVEKKNRLWIILSTDDIFFFGWYRIPSKFPHNRMLQSYRCPVLIQFQWQWCLQFFSHCMVLNFCQILYRLDKTCVEPHVPHLCQ